MVRNYIPPYNREEPVDLYLSFVHRDLFLIGSDSIWCRRYMVEQKYLNQNARTSFPPCVQCSANIIATRLVYQVARAWQCSYFSKY